MFYQLCKSSTSEKEGNLLDIIGWFGQKAFHNLYEMFQQNTKMFKFFNDISNKINVYRGEIYYLFYNLQN